MPDGDDREKPSGTGHVPTRKAPGEGASRDRELTEYRVPEADRDSPGSRERERESGAEPDAGP